MGDMRTRPASLHRHRWLATLAVLAFALRALIPAGFMPGGSGALSLEICPDGFPAALLAGSTDHSGHAGHHDHHHPGSDATAAADAGSGPSPAAPTHDHRSWSSGHCVFSAVAAAPPLSHAPHFEEVAQTAALLVEVDATPLALEIRFRIAQPRAPPSLV